MRERENESDRSNAAEYTECGGGREQPQNELSNATD